MWGERERERERERRDEREGGGGERGGRRGGGWVEREMGESMMESEHPCLTRALYCSLCRNGP